MTLRRTRAFTLLELIVVIVVLGLLAALAIPTFTQVIQRSGDETTRTSLAAVGRDALALASFDADGRFLDDDAITAVEEAHWSVGIAALNSVSYAISSPAPSTLGMATRSPSGRCVYATVVFSSVKTRLGEKGGTCVGSDALDGADSGSGSGTPVTGPVSTVPVPRDVTSDSAVIGWTPVPGADGYEVVISDDPDMSDPVVIQVPPTQTSVTVPNLEPGETKYVTIITDNDGTKTPGATVPVTTKPAKPILTASIVNGAPVLTWTTSPSDVSYGVYRDDALIFFVPVKDTTAVDANTVSWTDRNVTPGLHSYHVAPLGAGGLGTPSDPASVTAPSAPGAPTGVTGDHGPSGKVLVRWTAPNDGGAAITSYMVIASNGTVLTVPAPATSAVLSLPAGTYTFLVQATNSVGSTISAQSPSYGHYPVSAN